MIKRVIYAVCVFCMLLTVSCSGSKEGEEKKDTDKAFLKTIKTIKAELSNQNEELTLTGKVEYDPDKVINYVTLVNGIADRTYFSLGDKVKKGQPLLDIRSSDLSSLQSEYVTAELNVKIAEREMKASQSMYDDSMLSERDLIEAESKLKQAKAEYNKIQSDINVHGVNKGNGMFSIKSPMTGYIVGKNISSGSSISSEGEPLFTVADLSTVWITANVYAGNLLFVKDGMDVSITTHSYPGEVFFGKISSLSQVFDPEEKVLKARIVMPNNDLKFKPEMSVVIKLKNETHNRFISLPTDALVFDDDRYFVIVEASAGNFEAREVKLQGHNAKTTYIASGIEEGENVVVKNQLLIYSGLKEN